VGINLTKGGTVDLTKEAGGSLSKVRVGLGWDAGADLDASVVAVDASSNAVSKDWFVFYNQLKSPGDVIVHQGDERTGETEGDDEQIVIDLAGLPAEANQLLVYVTIHDEGKTFAEVNSAYVRITDEANGNEIARYDLTHDAGPGVNALTFGALVRSGGGWVFNAIGDGATTGIEGVVDKHKIG